MTSTNLTIFIRLMGIFFIWQGVQAILAFFAIFLSPQAVGQSQNILNLLSSTSPQGYYLKIILFSGVGQFFLGTALILWAKKIVKLLANSLKLDSETKTTNSTIVIQISGLLLLFLGLKDAIKIVPLAVSVYENPLTSPSLVILIIQIGVSLYLILRPKFLSNFLNRFSR